MTNEPGQGQGEQNLEGILTHPPIMVVAEIVTDSKEDVLRVGFRVSEVDEQIIITEKQAKRLEQLVSSPAVGSVAERIGTVGVDPIQGDFKEYIKRVAGLTGTLTRDEKRMIMKGFAAIYEHQANFLNAAIDVYDVREKYANGERVHLPTLLAAYRKAHDALQTELKKTTDDPRFIKLKRFLSKGMPTCTHEEKELITEGRRKYTLLEGELTLAALSLKLERLDVLMEVSPLNAARYATAGLPSELITPELKAILDQEIDVDKDGIRAYQKFWEVDGEVYRTIINRFQTLPKAQPVKQEQKLPAVLSSVVQPKEPEPVTYESMKKALFGNLNLTGKRGKVADKLLIYLISNLGLTQDQLRSVQNTAQEFCYFGLMGRKSLSPTQEEVFWNRVAITLGEKKDRVGKRDFRDTYQSSLAYKPGSA